MAREAGMAFADLFGGQRIIESWLPDLQRFEALVRADEREVRSLRWDEYIAKAIEAEREACAKVCYELPWKDMGHIPSNLAFAAAIRNRGKT
jgi:hypothetical protein